MRTITLVAIPLACIGALAVVMAVHGSHEHGAVEAAAVPAVWGPPAPAVLVPDAQGDARDHSITSVDFGSQCRFACGRIEQVTGFPVAFPGTVPAPWFDITEAGFLSETEDTIRLAVKVDTLTEGFPELTPTPSVARGVDYIVCFGSDKGERCATLNVAPQRTGPMISSTFHIFSDACGAGLYNDLRSDRPTIAPVQHAPECAFEVPASVTYGRPGSIVFDVPKTYAELDGASSPWTHVRANVSHYWLQPAAFSHVAYSLSAPTFPHSHDHVGLPYPSGIADELPTTPTEIRFTPARSRLAPVEGPVANALPGLAYEDLAERHPVFDHLSTSIREEGPDVVVTQTFAGLERADAPDFEHMSLARVENGPLFEFGAFHVGDDWHAYVGACIHFHCANSSYLKLPLDVVEGTPAHLEFRVPREHFGNPTPGTRLTFLLTTTQEVHPSYYAEDGDENVHWMSAVDQHLGVLPYTFVGEAVEREVEGHAH